MKKRGLLVNCAAFLDSKDNSAVYKDKFPQIVRFPVIYIVFQIFKIVNGIDLTNMKKTKQFPLL